MSEQATIEETTDSSWQQIPQETVQSKEVYEEETTGNPIEVEKVDEINQSESNSISDSDFVTKEQLAGESEQVYENSQ
ncbi:TPA: hypothetical protein ACSPFO_002495 [Enterococcus faecium]